MTAQDQGVVGHVEKDRIGVIGGGRCCDCYMERHAVFYDDGNKLQEINKDEMTILVVLFVEEGALLELIGN